jgi:cobalt-zinc-cadmium efflux system outer membrane protein
MKDKIPLLFLTGIAVTTMVGCTHLPEEEYRPDEQIIEDKFQEKLTPDDLGKEKQAPEFEEPVGDISLLDAYAAALLNHPKLTAYGWKVRVREAQALQANLLPNPEVEFEVEEFGGSGSYGGFDSAETTLFFSQMVELGRKRSKRNTVARLERDAATWEYESARVDILAEVSKAFIKLLAYQQRHEMVKQNLELAESSYEAIEKSVEAGAISPLDLTKARVAVVQEKLEFYRIQNDLGVAKTQLAATWGSNLPKFDRTVGILALIEELPSVETLSKRIDQNPDIARWAVEIARHQAQIRYEKSQAIPDVKVGVGIKFYNESDDTAAVFGLSMPLGLFDRNQGNIRAAQYEFERALQQKREIELQINTTLTSSYRKLQSAHQEAQVMNGELYPAAKQAYNDIQKAYMEGKLGYLDVLDAQRTLFETQRDYLEALVRFHSIAIDIESLIGMPLSELTDQQPHLNYETGE